MGRQFSESARKASLDVRKARAEALAIDFGKPAVFVVRVGQDTFGWEIRQYGGIVLCKSAEGFPAPELARQAGETALPTTFDEASKVRRDIRLRPGKHPDLSGAAHRGDLASIGNG